MKNLSITQEYILCTVNEKGSLASYNQNAVACLIVSGLLELQLANCISLNDKKVHVCTTLPEHLSYLKPLYNIINQEKPMKAERVVETYTIAFTNQKLYELLDALMESLRKADAVEPVKTGLFSKKDSYAPKRGCRIKKIRAELLEDGKISEDVIALTALWIKQVIKILFFEIFNKKN